MNAREMHYDFKQKFNRVDSQQNRNFLVPEIDWKLNEAQDLFAKTIAQPRIKNKYGFEVNQRTIDDIRTIVVNQPEADGIVPTNFDSSSFIAALPTDYWFYITSRVLAVKGTCTKKIGTRPVQADDENEFSPFDRSSFEWQVSNVRFIRQGLRVFTDGTFSVTKVMYEYLKKPLRIQNAQDYIGGTYETLGGVVYTGSQSCELPEGTHSEIVDLAVLIAAIDLNLPEVNLKRLKINITN